MAFGFQPAGLFGRKAFGRKPLGDIALPGPISGFGGGTFNMDGTQATPVDRYPDAPMEMPQEAQQAAPKQGLFGKITSAMGNIGSILDDEPSPGEIENQRQRFIAEQSKARALAEQQAAEARRETDWSDWVRKQEYEAAHPKPVNNDTVADYNFIRDTLGDEAAATFLKNRADPPQYRQGPDGQFYRVQTGPSALPTAPVGKLTPITGGPQGNPAGTFLDAFADLQR